MAYSSQSLFDTPRLDPRMFYYEGNELLEQYYIMERLK